MPARNQRNILWAICCLSLIVPLNREGTAQARNAAPHPPAEEWSYDGANGPEHWGDLKPDFATCKLGRQQSPIDIRDARQDASLPPLQIQYKPSPLTLINNGHSIEIDYVPGSSLVVGGRRYELRQFHFHHPSEEEMNGKSYDMVIHLVHADAEGRLAVIAVLLKQGRTNPMIQKLWDNLPASKGKEQSAPGTMMDATALLPRTLSYYTFHGSLTTPPCSESVTWYVLKTPVEVSADQVAAFARLYPHNARPIQRLHGRVILESQ